MQAAGEGTLMPVGSSILAETITMTGAAIQPLGDFTGKIVRIETDGDIHYSLTGDAATAVDPSIPLNADKERYESVRAEGISLIGTVGINVVLIQMK